MKKLREIIPGERFNRLVAIRKNDPSERNRKWICQCDCGKITSVRQDTLIRGVTGSCGCYGQEMRTAANKRNAQYLWKLPEYKSYTKMKERCLSSASPDYHNYGGRGICICDRWLESFANFLADMGSRPSPAYSIERIDVNGNYEPGNCRWATKKEQSRNTRANRFLEFNGERLCMADWCKRIGISHATIIRRLDSGWSVEKTLTAPPDKTVTQFKKGQNSHKNMPKVAAF